MFLHLYRVMIRLKSQLHFLHDLIDAKPQARSALLSSADDELIKAIVECITIDENSKLKKHKIRLRALVNPKISFNSKRNLLVQKCGFIVPLLASVLSFEIGSLINNN